MPIPLYQVDAFTNELFGGNPAAVCPLEEWLPDATLQAIAAENNLSETAFFSPEGDGFRLRWFTPIREVDLCGHATLATAFVLFERQGFRGDTLRFQSRSGLLLAERGADGITLDFPAGAAQPCQAPRGLAEALGIEPVECLKANDYLVVLRDEEAVRSAKPDFRALAEVELRGVAITAQGNDVDFVSRFFAPSYGINEDPVTGAAHCLLAPYWAGVLGKQQLKAEQVSSRGGEVLCGVADDRVYLTGQAVLYLEGAITINR